MLSGNRGRKDGYIAEAGNEWNPSKVVDILTPRQFQDSVESRKYSFDY
jgi:hypothetical protein